MREALKQEGIRFGKLLLVRRKGSVHPWMGQEIIARKDVYKFCISNREGLIIFHERIGFTIYYKQRNLEGMLNSYKRPLRKTTIEKAP